MQKPRKHGVLLIHKYIEKTQSKKQAFYLHETRVSTQNNVRKQRRRIFWWVNRVRPCLNRLWQTIRQVCHFNAESRKNPDSKIITTLLRSLSLSLMLLLLLLLLLSYSLAFTTLDYDCYCRGYDTYPCRYSYSYDYPYCYFECCYSVLTHHLLLFTVCCVLLLLLVLLLWKCSDRTAGHIHGVFRN